MPRPLTAREIKEELDGLSGWSHRGHFITKTFQFEDFLEGMAFLRRVAREAERRQHHPDIRIRYARVTLSLQTHSEGGVTRRDIALARAIERVGGRASVLGR